MGINRPIGTSSEAGQTAFGFEAVFTSNEFWAALFGALAGALVAFLLEALRRWWTDNSRRQAAINLALLSLAQMYTVMGNYHDQVFVRGREMLMSVGPDEPPAWAYQPAHGLSELQLRLNYEELGVLLKSHDSDLLHRLLAAERIYFGAHYQMLEHLKLHREFQHRLAEAREADAFNAPPTPLEDIVGQDLLAQLTSIAKSLRDQTPDDLRQVSAAASQLREVARIHFPTRRFVGMDLVPAKEATTPPKEIRPAAWWRRAIRGCKDALAKRNAVWPEVRGK